MAVGQFCVHSLTTTDLCSMYRVTGDNHCVPGGGSFCSSTVGGQQAQRGVQAVWKCSEEGCCGSGDLVDLHITAVSESPLFLVPCSCLLVVQYSIQMLQYLHLPCPSLTSSHSLHIIILVMQFISGRALQASQYCSSSVIYVVFCRIVASLESCILYHIASC